MRPAATATAQVASGASRTNEERRHDRAARLAARAAPHADAIRRFLHEASVANGGAWPRHIDAKALDAAAKDLSGLKTIVCDVSKRGDIERMVAGAVGIARAADRRLELSRGHALPERVFVVGGAGATEVDGVKLVDQPGFPAAYAPEARTLSAVLDLYRASKALRWTMLAPAPLIAPGERTGKYTLGKDSPAGERVSTQDFAVAVLDELENPRHENERFTVAS